MKSYAAQSRANQAKGNQRWSRHSNANRPTPHTPQGYAFGWHAKQRGERVKDMVKTFDRENPNFSGRDFAPDEGPVAPEYQPIPPTDIQDHYTPTQTNLNNSLAEAWKVSGDRWRTRK